MIFILEKINPSTGSVHKVCPGVEDKNTKKRKRKKNVIAYQQEPILDYIERACEYMYI